MLGRRQYLQQVGNQGFANGGFDNCNFGEIQIPKWQIKQNANMWISVFRQEFDTEIRIFVFFGFTNFGLGFPQNGNYQNPRLQNPGFGGPEGYIGGGVRVFGGMGDNIKNHFCLISQPGWDESHWDLLG